MKIRNQYIIPFGGLKEGYHTFNFKATGKFFEEYPELEAKNGNLDILIRLLKKSTFLTFDVAIEGYLNLQCDRCLDYYNQTIEFEGKLYVKFSERNEQSDENDDVIFLNPGEHEIDLVHYIYESISLSIPYKRVHPDTNGVSNCNNSIIKELDNHSGKEKDTEPNPVWDKLKDFLATNNN